MKTKIIDFLQGWFKALGSVTIQPMSEVTDTKSPHQQYFLNIVLLGLSIPGILFSLTMLVMWRMGLVPTITPFIGLGMQPFYALAYGLVRRGYEKLAAWIVIGTIMTSITVVSVYVGIGHITLIGLTIATALAGILIGLWAACGIALLSGGVYLIVGLIQVTGHLPHPISPESTVIPEAVGLTMGLLSIAVLNWFSRHELRKSLAHQRMAESFRRSSEQYRAIFDALDDYRNTIWGIIYYRRRAISRDL